MISASHNPYHDNGIKLFGPDGYKLSDEIEGRIEAMLDGGPDIAARHAGRPRPRQAHRRRPGPLHRIRQATCPARLSLAGLRIVVDCANGAAYKVAPEALWELGAEVITIGDEPNGFNINLDCGSTHPRNLAKKVHEVRADIGIALDGDADRLVIVDENGHRGGRRPDDGADRRILAPAGRLAGGGVVATVMSNLGLERFLGGVGLQLHAPRRRPLRGRAYARRTGSMSAASNRATSCCPTSPPPATGWSRRCRCLRA